MGYCTTQQRNTAQHREHGRVPDLCVAVRHLSSLKLEGLVCWIEIIISRPSYYPFPGRGILGIPIERRQLHGFHVDFQRSLQLCFSNCV